MRNSNNSGRKNVAAQSRGQAGKNPSSAGVSNSIGAYGRQKNSYAMGQQSSVGRRNGVGTSGGPGYMNEPSNKRYGMNNSPS